MKGTEHFTRTIAEYLNQRAMTDPLFAPNLMKPNKNIEECITYILNEVQKSGCNGFDDDEIFSMASLNSFSGGITLKSSQKLLSYTNGVSAKMVCTDNRSLWSKRLTLSVSILQVTISNHVCRMVLLSHLFFCFILKCKSPRTWWM